MGRVARATAAMALSAVVLAACGTTPAAPFRGEGLARQIADDAVAFNEAYARAVSGQLLLNVLRARDRQPRYYLSMSGIQDAPGLRYRENFGISGTPLGEGASPWGFGNFGFERETQSRPSYAVQPLSAETLTRTVFQPTPSNVFEHYWQSGWSRDLLLFLMVEEITRIDHVDGPPVVREFINDATQLRDDCRGDDALAGCAYVIETRRFLADIAMRAPARERPGAAPVCGLVESFDTPQPLMAARDGKGCEPRFVVGETTFVLSLRSFDDMIFYVGELMRPSTTETGEETTMEARLTVFAAGLRSDRGVPLFRILPASEASRAAPRDPHLHYAASVNYSGRRFFAGPPVGRSCVRASPDGVCADDPAAGDRSSSVLSLLAELLALNQSPEAIRAPNRIIVD
ncbi:MAG: hypothetical protein IV086_00560 [Hyphomonadaceae bacterium]|nr:MAG: hypothetical protein FD160_1361 [Caulobacteraceae bacterium]MBT9444168.1 hypothetical protein [Hyphomonadaceae bacterium]TPW04912.1 MAG: hypothetical protein FD124_2425 [Alphaproteobacteria bacterium]